MACSWPFDGCDCNSTQQPTSSCCCSVWISLLDHAEHFEQLRFYDKVGTKLLQDMSTCNALTQAIQAMHGSATVAGMANLTISLKKHVNMLATSILEARTRPQRAQEAVGPTDVATLAVNYLKHSVCLILKSEGIGTCKLQALTTLLGYKRMWVAAFGISAAVACWAYVPSASSEDIVLRSVSPWQDMAYEMWHICRHFQHHCITDANVKFPEVIIRKLSCLSRALECESAWQQGSLLWHMTSGELTDSLHASSGVDTVAAQALQIVMPVKVFMRATVSIAADWVYLAGRQILCGTKASSKVGDCAEEHANRVIDFMIDMLDAILFKSLHVLINSNLQAVCSLAIFAAIKAAANRELKLVPVAVVHLHVCLDAVGRVAGPYPQHIPAVGSNGYRQMKAVFNELMLVNETKVRSWIMNTATAINRGIQNA